MWSDPICSINIKTQHNLVNANVQLKHRSLGFLFVPDTNVYCDDLLYKPLNEGDLSNEHVVVQEMDLMGIAGKWICLLLYTKHVSKHRVFLSFCTIISNANHKFSGQCNMQPFIIIQMTTNMGGYDSP